MLDHLLAGTVRIFTAHSRQWAPMLRRSLELVLVVGAARRERLLGAAKGLVDILLEITLKEGDRPELLATNRLNDPIDASPAVAGKQLFLRAHGRVYCIEGK